ILIAERAGQPIGYALVWRDGKWDGHLPASTATVREFQAVDAASAYALWRTLVNLDLQRTIVTPLLAIDDPLFGWLEDWRAASPRWQDAEHLRIVDLPAALGARRYSAPIDLRLAVTDDLLEANAGLWRLRGGPEGAQVTRITAANRSARLAADLTLDIRQLGSLYLGGIKAVGLVDAGLITEHRAGAAEAIGRAFSGDRAPAPRPVF
ncbi:MAG: sterol carrier protein domain-containing protein, partial [Bifidobacteriaceae bacterium]|nr:sterol carrier protein domain-containing protein [Bifidobacteriaceae bacterium]